MTAKLRKIGKERMNLNINNVAQTIRLREYYYMLTRHKKALGVVITIACTMAIIMALVLPKIFRAETVLLVEDKNILNPLISGLAISPSVSSRIRTMKEELLSWQRLTLLVEKLKLDKQVRTPHEYEKLIRNLRNNLSIRFRGTDIITVSFDDPDPKKAQEIVQTLSDIIVGGSLTSQKIEANSAIRFIDEQLTAYKKKLETSEEELRRFKELYNAT